MTNLTLPRYHDDEAARKYLEGVLWPSGPVCPHCGGIGKAYQTKKAGLYRCASKECAKDFTVTVGTVMERSKIKLHKWVLGFALMTASKKGISAHQLHRMLGVTYKTAWFMAMRIREAMAVGYVKTDNGLGGSGKTVEADEAYFGPNPQKDTRVLRIPREARARKAIVFSLVERGGKVKSFKISTADKNTLRGIMQDQIDERSRVMTDENTSYHHALRSFKGGHSKINHGKGRYVVRGDVHTNTVENYFSILKRGISGIYQHVSEQHLHRYLSEFDFRYSNRAALEIDDATRAAIAAKGAAGKRLMYRQPD